MQEIRLRVKKRAFPSHGRIRVHVSALQDLGVKEGESVDLINPAGPGTVSVAVFADTMVGEGQVRVSEEDLSALGLQDGEEAIVIKTPPLHEKVKKVAGETSKKVSAGVERLDEKVRAGSKDAVEGTKKAAGAIKKEAEQAARTAGKVAGKTAEKVKKSVKPKKGSGDDL
jgi:ribosome recycling factor